MDDVRGYFLGPPHGTTPAAAIAIGWLHGNVCHSTLLTSSCTAMSQYVVDILLHGNV